jgi:hypothetical protein
MKAARQHAMSIPISWELAHSFRKPAASFNELHMRSSATQSVCGSRLSAPRENATQSLFTLEDIIENRPGLFLYDVKDIKRTTKDTFDVSGLSPVSLDCTWLFGSDLPAREG